MFRSISRNVSNRQDLFIKKNSGQEVIDEVMKQFLTSTIGFVQSGTVKASLENGNLYISTPHKALANEIVFKARSLYAALKERRITCNNLVIR